MQKKWLALILQNKVINIYTYAKIQIQYKTRTTPQYIRKICIKKEMKNKQIKI